MVTDPDDRDHAEELASALDEIRRRAGEAAIEIEERVPPDGKRSLALLLPAGQRNQRRVQMTRLSSMKRLLAIDFQKYSFLGQYEAICSFEDGSIEAAIRTRAAFGDEVVRIRELFGLDEREAESLLEAPEWQLEGRNQAVTLSIGPPSPEFHVLFNGMPRARRGLTLKISGLIIRTHDQALSALEKLANSHFFQLEVVFGVVLALLPSRRPPSVLRRRAKATSSTLREIGFPRYEYDAQPMSLYWYGTSATGMPLLQFLAYYQAIEFYFPVYSEYDARRRIRNVLKDPAFNPESDASLGRLLSAVAMRRSGAYGSERDQLVATIEVCVDASELASFIGETVKRTEFFRAQNPGLTTYRIRLGEGGDDVRQQVAFRMYDIRCRIVHAKDSAEAGNVILPFSREAELLRHDIDLARFVARQVLIAGSKPLAI